MVLPLRHDNLLSDATIPQPYYLIHWSKKAGVLYLTKNLFTLRRHNTTPAVMPLPY